MLGNNLIIAYINEFEERVMELSKQSSHISQSKRNKIVHELLESFFNYIGEYPKPALLTMLSDYILFDLLKDNHPDKVTREEYPILSERQLQRRTIKQFSAKAQTIDFLNSKFKENLSALNRKTKELSA